MLAFTKRELSLRVISYQKISRWWNVVAILILDYTLYQILFWFGQALNTDLWLFLLLIDSKSVRTELALQAAYESLLDPLFFFKALSSEILLDTVNRNFLLGGVRSFDLDVALRPRAIHNTRPPAKRKANQLASMVPGRGKEPIPVSRCGSCRIGVYCVPCDYSRVCRDFPDKHCLVIVIVMTPLLRLGFVDYAKLTASTCAFSAPFALTCRSGNRRASFHP
jgi:hypothetical protein